ncbi:MAG TPA: Re/Si-specific NAD(P)(+) transhydrogenase subunit alpha [Gaiellales bacterium]|jgi:NAD(P) transhydrogenase subunit alpha|nr:Re/Si-specific NAD(P)(+) transhydrogenase subunit alpha [Gaiellales bacterium]
MIVAVPSERGPGERRVALTPDAVPRLGGRGLTVLLEPGAGDAAALPDDAYREAGAEIAGGADDLYGRADIVVRIGKVEPEDIAPLRSGTALVGYLQPLTRPDIVAALTDAGVTAFAMEAIPRVTRAQRMDSLSSQATVAGYRSVILAADALPKFFPMLMTAAGTVAPAKVLVLGAGVAGLQAIATARRLGAVVSAFDTRAVVREQVQSLGASFVELEMEVGEAQDARGYATVLSESQQEEQQRLLERHIADSDVVITTALVPGRPAPRLIPADAVEAMRAGSVIVDLAAETGGNCELTEPGETIVRHGVTVIGELNLPSGMPLHASQMYARNLQAVLEHLVVDGALHLDFEDEITADAVITHEGRVTSRLLQGAAA